MGEVQAQNCSRERARFHVLLCVSFGLLLTACAAPEVPVSQAARATASSPAAAAPIAMPAAQATKWDAVLGRWIANSKFSACDAPGGVLLVDSPAGRYLKAAGVSSVETQRPVSTGDVFEIGSNTKSFTVVLALQLQEAGLLGMDDLLSKWLPEMAARIPGGDRITLRQLAGNTSGIPDYANALMQPLIDANDRPGLMKAYTPAELVAFGLATGAPAFGPGESWQYSSTNFILLGMVVEAASGKSLAALYKARIFDVLGMSRTTYLEGSPAPGSIVDGYYTVSGKERINVTSWNATQAGAAGAILSTAEDMARYARGLMRGALFRERATLDSMQRLTELRAPLGGMLMKGYGLGLISFRTSGYQAIGHGGQTPGFQTVWFEVPQADTRVVFFANSGTCLADFLPIVLPPTIFGLAETSR